MPSGADRGEFYTLGTAMGTTPANSVGDPSNRFAQTGRKAGYTHNTGPAVHRGLELLDVKQS